MKIEFDVNALTLGEAEDLEEYTGMTVDAFAVLLQQAQREGKAPPTKVLTALVWIAGRREDPTFTVAKARESKVMELDFGEVTQPNRAARRAGPNSGAAARK